MQPCLLLLLALVAAAAAASSASASECSVSRALEWATKRGADLSKVVPRRFLEPNVVRMPDYFSEEEHHHIGLMLKEDVNANEAIMEFPTEGYAITTETVRAGPLGAIADLVSPRNLLVLFLVAEAHNPQSAYHPYLCLQPRDSVELLRSDSMFVGAKEQARITKLRQHARALWNDMWLVRSNHSHLFPEGSLTLKNFMWALSTLRQSGVQRKVVFSPTGTAVDNELTIVPFVDLLNHTIAGWVVSVNFKTNTLRIQADRWWHRGRELQLSDHVASLADPTDQTFVHDARVQDMFKVKLLFPNLQQDCSVDKLMEWLITTAGATFQPIGVANFSIERVKTDKDFWWLDEQPQRRGIVALKDFAPGEEIIRIPSTGNVLLNRFTALTTPLRTALEANGLLFPNRSSEAVMMLLIHEGMLGSSSHWSRYLCTLMGTEDLPTLATNEVVDALPEDVREHVWSVKREGRMRWNGVVPWLRYAFPDLLKGMTLRHWYWAHAMVNSRTWAPKMEGKDATTMVPFMDMVNHHKDWHSVDIPRDDQGLPIFVLRAGKEGYRAGQEIFLAYQHPGKRNDTALAARYGIFLFPEDEESRSSSSSSNNNNSNRADEKSRKARQATSKNVDEDEEVSGEDAVRQLRMQEALGNLEEDLVAA